MYRISQNGQEPVIDVDTVEAIEPAIRSSELGRHQVGEISADPLPSGCTSRLRGVGTKRDYGTVLIEPDPWPAS